MALTRSRHMGALLACTALLATTATALVAAPASATPCTSYGTNGADSVAIVGDGEVYCGRGGDDTVGVLGQGGTFIGGPGDDVVSLSYAPATFNGGPGYDSITICLLAFPDLIRVEEQARVSCEG